MHYMHYTHYLHSVLTLVEAHLVALHSVGGHGQQVAALPGDLVDEVAVAGAQHAVRVLGMVVYREMCGVL